MHEEPKDAMTGLPQGMTRWLLVGVFFTFAPVGCLLMMIATPPHGWMSGLVSMTISGIIGLGWSYTFLTRRFWMLALVIPFSMGGHWGTFYALSRFHIGDWSPLDLGMSFSPTLRLAILAAMAISSLAVGYVYTIRVTRMWERAHARHRAELDVAAKVHETIVPPIERRTPTYEIFGRSRACSEMGGDLIDVVGHTTVTDVYVVDVSGHGVGAGIVMGMIKSALRMRLRAEGTLDAVLTDLNVIVCDLTRPEMFATLACLRLHEGGRTEFALAGHLPILHGHSGSLSQLPNDHLPLGLIAEEKLSCGEVTMAPGDTLAIFTDGLIEVMDAQGEQFGLDRFIDAFHKAADLPLEELNARLMTVAENHGLQIDDQSLVLVRRKA